MTWLLELIIKVCLQFLYGKGDDYRKALAALDAAKAEIHQVNKGIADKNEKAVTPEEREDAADEIFRHFDGN